MYGGFTPGGTHYSTGAYGAPPTGAYNAAAVSNAYAAGAVAAAPYFSTPGYASAYQTQTAASGTPTTAFSSRVDTFASPTAPVRSTTSSYTTGVTRGASNSVGMPRMPSSNAGSPVRTNVTVTNLTTGGTGGTSTYTGYDAAVYAAATSYLQSKATGGSGTWLGLRKSGGTGGTRGSFPNKSRGGFGGSGGGGGGQQQLHYCEVCKISCAGPQTYREHLEGQRHKKKEALLKGSAQQPLAKSKVSFRCDLCQVTCTGQDTYNAHVRGQKHLKTLKLHQTLGKPIPSNEPTMIAPSQPPPMPAGAAGAGAGAKKVIGVPQMSFVGGQKLTTTATGQPVEVSSPTSAAAANDAMQAALLAEQNVQPVGDDYVEPIKDHTGKLVQYFCKLCDCKFNDLNAKDMHLKGRRHRLQFKKKVNPDLEVEMKPNTMTMRMRRATDERQRKEMMRMRQQEMWSMRGMYPNAPTPLFGGNQGMPKPLFGGPHDGRTGQRGETNDDRHVMAKHVAIYPTEDQISSVQKLVNDTEKALKAVSDHYAELEKSASEAKTTTPAATEMEDDTASADGVAALKLADSEKKEEKPKPADERLLKGVMRVGLLAKGLLLRGDTTVNLVVLCSELPTRSLLADIGDLLPKELANVTEEQYDVSLKPEESCLVVKSKTEPVIECFVTLTSVLMREIVAEGDATTTRDTGTLLPAHFCLQALAELRHAKWFQARCSNLQSCLVTLRIMRDICQRIPTWGPLSIWATELLIEKVLTSCGMPLSPGDALRRVFEAVAAGVLLPNGPGLLDPCEKDVMDALTGLTPQQREDITSSAQHALRLIAFNQLYKILAIDRLPDRRVERKRPRDSNGSSDEGRLMNGNKKDKKEENGVEMADASATAQMAAA